MMPGSRFVATTDASVKVSEAGSKHGPRGAVTRWSGVIASYAEGMKTQTPFKRLILTDVRHGRYVFDHFGA